MTQQQTSPYAQFQLDLDAGRRRELVRKTNAALQQAREELVRECTVEGGLKSSRKYCATIDGILRGICAWLVKEARLARGDYKRLAIIAQGGYGRGELNPHSDIDLLFLVPDNPTPIEQAFVKSFLYVLWDLNKLDIGYATKRLPEALSAVGADLDSTTALIQTRLVAGNRKKADELAARLFNLLHGDNQKWFLSLKIAEAAERRRKFGSSVYLLEPNIKDGEGGLRDVHSMQWLSYVLLGSSNLDTLVKREVFTRKELQAVKRGMDILLQLRTLLHQLEGRKSDVLSFDKQPAIAAALGYTSDEKLLAEEKMMKDYYLHAREIDRYSQKAERILSVHARPLIGMFAVIRRRSINEDYYMKAGVLFSKKSRPQFYAEDPCRIMECFAIAARLQTPLSEELKDLLIEAGEMMDPKTLQNSQSCTKCFMQIMGQRQFVAQTLHAMHQTGVLSAYIPEFAKLFCLARIDHYHKYTVDIHLIKTLEISTSLINEEPGHQPELINAAKSIGQWDLLNLSLLLHDIGKGEGHGHVLRGAVLSQKITQRMGLAPQEQEVVRQLILQHLKMVHISQRRDLDDPHVIAEMARAVPDPELLTMLYVLTYCDTRAVSPSAWTDWKGLLLFNLYSKTMLLLEGKDPLPPIGAEQRARIARRVLAAANGEIQPEELENFLNNASPKYIQSVSPAKMARHIQMLKKITPEDRIAWELHEPEGLNYTEITAVSYDVPGLMSLLCRALSSKDINILSLQAFSTKDGYAIDTFQVTDLRGNKLPHGFHLERVRADLNQVLLKQASPEEKFKIRAKRGGVGPEVSVVKPVQVILDNDASPNYTVLEVKAYDRPGLLYEITSVCAEQKYVIHLAMITTEAYRVVDVFYLTDYENNKLEQNQIKRLKAALEQVAG